MKSNDYWVLRSLREANLNKSIDQLNKELLRCYQKSSKRLAIELKRLYLEIMEKEGKVLVSHLYQYNRYYKIMNLIEEESIRLGKEQQALFEKELTGVYNYNQKLLNNDFDVFLNKEAVQESVNMI